MLGRSGKGSSPTTDGRTNAVVEPRAGQRKYHGIELAVADLHGMLDALR